MIGFSFEPKNAPLAPLRKFGARVASSALFALALVAAMLGVGMAGYHWIAELSWLDAFHQAALLLSGMGPVETMSSASAKVFDGCYALLCGIVLLAVTGLLFAPFVHRIMHKFHVEDPGK
jgi:hypothetical protein